VCCSLATFPQDLQREGKKNMVREPLRLETAITVTVIPASHGKGNVGQVFLSKAE
jgi:hypothetical protein